MESKEQKICRFCFSSPNSLINIFDDESEANLVEIIAEHIGEVNQYDTLPKCSCVACWRRIEDFHNFHRSVLNAQEEYLKRAVKREIEIEREPDHASSSHETIKPPNFIEVLTNCEEFNEFADVAIKTNAEFDDNNQHEIKLQDVDALFNGTPSVMDEEESNEVAYDDEDGDNDDDDDDVNDNDGDNDYYEEENEDQEADSKHDSESISKESDEVDAATKRKIYAENFDTTCDICSIDLKSLKRAVSHYKHKHDIEEGYIKCCGLKLKRVQTIQDHIRWHINPNIFKCRYCDRIMKTKLSLSTHIANHRHAKTFTCDICGKIFSQISKIKNHILMHARSTVCPICDKPCSTKEKLEAHLKFSHKSDEVRKQWDHMARVKKIVVNAEAIEKVMAAHFNMKCDHCDSVFKSLQESQFHYMHEHQIADGYIQCCGLKFKKTVNIEGHVLWHLRPELFLCCVCQKDSITTVALRAHLRVHETRQMPKDNTCEKCNKTFVGKHHVNRHMKRVHGIVVPTRTRNLNAIVPDSNDIKSFFDMHCDVCKLQLSSLQHAKLHYLDEHNIPDGYIKCCEMKFRELKNINDHLQYHVNPSIFRCEICSKVFPRKADLSAHMSQHKAVATKKFSCNECGKIWKSKYRLEIHKRSHEEKTARTFPCSYCNRKFSTEQLQKSHTFRIHETNKDPKTEICEYCAKTFTTRKEVLAHIRSMHMENTIRRERVQCEICSAWLSNRYTLKDHMIRHNSGPQKCTQCDKVSPNQHALLCHVREVHCDRIFNCHLCPKTFKAAIALKDHIATHTGEKTYKCTFCPEAFIWRPNMYSHRKKAHPELVAKTKGDVRRRKINSN